MKKITTVEGDKQTVEVQLDHVDIAEAIRKHAGLAADSTVAFEVGFKGRVTSVESIVATCNGKPSADHLPTSSGETVVMTVTPSTS